MLQSEIRFLKNQFHSEASGEAPFTKSPRAEMIISKPSYNYKKMRKSKHDRFEHKLFKLIHTLK